MKRVQVLLPALERVKFFGVSKNLTLFCGNKLPIAGCARHLVMEAVSLIARAIRRSYSATVHSASQPPPAFLLL